MAADELTVEGNETNSSAYDQSDESNIKSFENAEAYEKERVKIEASILASSQSVMSLLFEEHPDVESGKCISRLERQTHSFTSTTLAYSEVLHDSFFRIFTKLNRLGFADGNEGKFVDIGAGIGKAVFAAALSHDFSKVVGIEILSGLHAASLKVLESWNVAKKDLPQKKQDMAIELLLGDALTINWSDETDVAFINATCFTSKMIAILSSEACRLRPGSMVIITSHKLDAAASTYLDCCIEETMAMSFPGEVKVYIYKRNKRNPLGTIDYAKHVIELLETGAKL